VRVLMVSWNTATQPASFRDATWASVD